MHRPLSTYTPCSYPFHLDIRPLLRSGPASQFELLWILGQGDGRQQYLYSLFFEVLGYVEPELADGGHAQRGGGSAATTVTIAIVSIIIVIITSGRKLIHEHSTGVLFLESLPEVFVVFLSVQRMGKG